ncbi:hypothetical protein BGZ67_001671 [Mortierella alpina]|nr:hypothetical protein BGZ67_001671 [Mortierella alpina]
MATMSRRSSRLATKAPEPVSTSIAAFASSTSSASSDATAAVTSSDKRTSKKAKTAAASGQVSKDTHKKPLDAATSSTKAKTQGTTKKTPTQRASKKRPADASATDTTLTKDAHTANGADDPKTKPTKRRRTAKADDSSGCNTTTTTSDAGPSSQKVTVNPSDPCSVLPTEIWHKVISHLPLSQVANTSWVSKTWLDGARAWRMWQQICEKCKLGTPKLKYKTFMAIVCANSFFICDKCYSLSTGSGSYVRRSEIPLKVKVVVKEGRPRQETKTGNDDDDDDSDDDDKDSVDNVQSAGSAETQARGSVAEKTLGAQTEQGQQKGSAQISASSTHSQMTAQTQENKDKIVDKHPDAPQDKNHRDGVNDQNQKQSQSQSQSQNVGQAVKQEKGKGKAKEELGEEVTEDWNLCLQCRQKYYRDRPEPIDHEWQEMMGETRITKTNARDRYHLSEMDLCGIPCEEYDNPHYRYGAPMCLYEIDDVEEEALLVHGGWIGIRAVGRETARKRRAAFKARQAAANPRRVSQKVADKKRKLKLKKL